MRVWSRFMSLPSTLAMGGIALFLSAPSAAADHVIPTAPKCTAQFDTWIDDSGVFYLEGGKATCSSGSRGDSFRVVVTCKELQSGDTYMVYGEWTWYAPGAESTAYCLGNLGWWDRSINQEVETRS